MKYLLVVALLITCTIASRFSVAIISDTHYGDSEGEKTADKIRKVVNIVNANIEKHNIKWVFLTGDITDNGYPTSYEGINDLLKDLKVHWFPLPGNHDILSHNESWVADKPYGDIIFGNTFKQQFTNVPGLNYTDKIIFNPATKTESWFHNFELRYENVVFFGLDWVSRTKGLDYTKKVLANAEIHNFPGGTIFWLRERLQKIAKEVQKPKNIIFLQHHPFNITPIPQFFMGFSEVNKTKIRDVCTEFLSISDYWGVFAGHIHRWFDGMAFGGVKGWEKFRQWETHSAKEAPVVTLAVFEDSKIVKIDKMYIL
jgi:DNA repair exonuclease SbcCD nuclease subunit